MALETFRSEDIGLFLLMAAAEGWVTGRYELDFLLTAFPKGCFCMQDETGATVGFVTSLKHDRSGWIGNLIVKPECRGRGIGELLFARASNALQDAGVESIWLTASEMGRPLYEKRGFKSIDRIIRWAGQADGSGDCTGRDTAWFDAALDRLCWGDQRELLLRWITGRGTVVAEESAWAVIQPVGEAVQIGPCSARDHRAAGLVISSALAAVDAGTSVLCDAPSSNGLNVALFQKLGFSARGETYLMYAGLKPDYRPAYLYGLATLGSSG
jgi:ribosomal protein S18 acetylase RimI-like enzyme